MKILLAGGGTLGSSSPLISIYEEAKSQGKNWEWFWAGTRNGVENSVVKPFGIKYEWIPEAKLRRYFSFNTFLLPFLLAAAFLRSIFIILTINPDIVIGAGSFVSVPVVWAARIFKKKTIIHQQDIKPTLSNKITSRAAKKITVSFKKSLQDFPKEKTEWTGNPVRDALLSCRKSASRERFNLIDSLPVVLITGGSSGSGALNKWVRANAGSISEKAQIIHLTGYKKSNPGFSHKNYHQVEFLNEGMYNAISVADVVIARAGVSTLTELAYLEKPAIIVPMPKTHQEENAFYVKQEGAAVVCGQEEFFNDGLRRLLALLSSCEDRKRLSRNMSKLMKKGARERIIQIIESIQTNEY